MEESNLIQVVTTVVTFFTLFFASSKNKREKRTEARKEIIDGVFLLQKLERKSEHYKNIKHVLKKRINDVYPPRKIHNCFYAIVGFILFPWAPVWGVYLLFENHAVVSFMLFLTGFVGYVLQVRSMYPGSEGGLPPIELAKEDARKSIPSRFLKKRSY